MVKIGPGPHAFWLVQNANGVGGAVATAKNGNENGDSCLRIDQIPRNVALFSSSREALAIKSSSYSVQLDCQCLGKLVP